MISQFVHHEYYFIDCLYPGLILLLLAVANFIKPTNKYFKCILSIGIILSLIKFADLFLAEKYSHKIWDRGEQVMQNYREAETLINELDIPLDAKLLCLDVHSTNRPLIWTNRKGYTLRNTKKEKVREAIQKFSFDYLIIQNQYLESDILSSDPEFLNHLQYIGSDNSITVAKWNQETIQQNAMDFLGFNDAKYFGLKDTIHHDQIRWD